jgi:xanthine dehydrogenase YagS FAD-binding subunit
MRIDELAVRMAEDGWVPRAGGTDLMSRRPAGPMRDLAGLTELSGVTWRDDGGVRLGALTTIASVAGDPRLRASHPALAMTAGGLATPQIRAVGTLGGNLLQRNRCWYFRNPAFSCHQTGGGSCPARTGRHLYSTVIDAGPCVAPHPSSLAMALLAYDASVEVHPRGEIPISELYGDGSDPTRDHLLGSGEVLVSVLLPPPRRGERAAYHRAIGRFEAEWPLVEAVACLVLDEPDTGTADVAGTTGTAGTIDGDPSERVIVAATVAVGGVARTPLRLPLVEAALVGERPTPETLATAAALATARRDPLPETGYKVPLLHGTVLEVLERATGVADTS